MVVAVKVEVVVMVMVTMLVVVAVIGNWWVEHEGGSGMRVVVVAVC